MRTLILIITFTVTTQFALGQTIEQKAIDYLVDNIKSLTINYQSGHFIFNPDSNKIWYAPKVLADKGKLKIKLQNGTSSSVEQFYKIIHDPKDIFIITHASENSGKEYFVKFDIVTNYDNHTLCTVYFDNRQIPVKIQ